MRGSAYWSVAASVAAGLALLAAPSVAKAQTWQVQTVLEEGSSTVDGVTTPRTSLPISAGSVPIGSVSAKAKFKTTITWDGGPNHAPPPDKVSIIERGKVSWMSAWSKHTPAMPDPNGSASGGGSTGLTDVTTWTPNPNTAQFKGAEINGFKMQRMSVPAGGSIEVTAELTVNASLSYNPMYAQGRAGGTIDSYSVSVVSAHAHPTNMREDLPFRHGVNPDNPPAQLTGFVVMQVKNIWDSTSGTLSDIPSNVEVYETVKYGTIPTPPFAQLSDVTYSTSGSARAPGPQGSLIDNHSFSFSDPNVVADTSYTGTQDYWFKCPTCSQTEHLMGPLTIGKHFKRTATGTVIELKVTKTGGPDVTGGIVIPPPP